MNLLDTYNCDFTSTLINYYQKNPIQSPTLSEKVPNLESLSLGAANLTQGDYKHEQQLGGIATSNILLSFHINNCHVKNLRTVIRKHSARIKNGDFSVPLNVRHWKKALNVASDPHNARYCCFPTFKNVLQCLEHAKPDDISKFSTYISDQSVTWPLSIDSCSLVNDRLTVNLQRVSAIRATLQQIEESGSEYGYQTEKDMTIYLTSEQTPSLDVTNYRLTRLQLHLQRLLKSGGYTVHITQPAFSNNSTGIDSLHLHLTTKNNLDCENNLKFKSLLVGVVVNQGTKQKDGMSASEYIRTKWIDFLERVEPHCVDTSRAECFANTAATIELLTPRMHIPVVVSMTENLKRDASFISYNVARCTKLLLRFDSMVKQKIYPPLPPLKSVDLNLLNKEEEWELVFDYLLPFPQLLLTSIEDVHDGRVHTHTLPHFLVEFAALFSVYYSGTKILIENLSDSQLPALFARIHLLMAINSVFRTALHLIGAEPVEPL